MDSPSFSRLSFLPTPSGVSLSAQQPTMVRSLAFHLLHLPICFALVQLLTPCSGRSICIYVPGVVTSNAQSEPWTPPHTWEAQTDSTPVRTECLSRCFLPHLPSLGHPLTLWPLAPSDAAPLSAHQLSLLWLDPQSPSWPWWVKSLNCPVTCPQ